MTNGGIGDSVLRKEDFKFLTGRGRFVADIALSGVQHAFILRSPFPHAVIKNINSDQAMHSPGVAAIFTGADMAADGIGPMLCMWPVTSADGKPMAEPPRWALAREKVRHVGEAVAVVIAETLEQAMDAAELIEIDYEELPVVVSALAAQQSGQSLLHEDASDNRCFVFQRGDESLAEQAFSEAAHIVEVDIFNNRLTGAALEPRNVISEFDVAGQSLTLHSSTQAPHHIRFLVAEQLGMNQGDIRVISPDVGGGFGYKGKHYPEETIIAWASRKLGGSVRWTASRSESFTCDLQSRDHHTRAKLALDADGKFIGLRVDTLANLGAYVSTFGAAIPSAIYSGLLAGIYATPAIFIEVTGVFTNTAPTDAYRGAGRPEACLVLERLADKAARVMGMDRADIRRLNMIQPEQMPFQTSIGPTYDSGDFPNILALAQKSSGFRKLELSGSSATSPGLLRGVGVACFVESSGVAPSRLAGAMGARAGFYESAQIRVDQSGGIKAYLGTHNHGQGHATTFAQIISDRLGVPLAEIDIIEGDTGRTPIGTGTFGSRSIAVGGSALDKATGKIIEKSKRLAAHLLETSVSDIEHDQGTYRVTGTDKKLLFSEISKAAYSAHNYPPEDFEPGLDETAFYDPENFAYSNGVHICEVEVDPETGKIHLQGYWVVDDIGTVINPVIVEGQIHGGLAQGLGQVLMEDATYDPESGQLLAGSFLDYAIPRAADLPHFKSEFDQSQPCTHNPLGAKGCGESGAIGAPAVVVSAVLDALEGLGVEDLDMPLTPENVWSAINSAPKSNSR